MPRDEKGGFHMSGLRPVGGKLLSKGLAKPASGVEGGSAENSEKITTLHDHGDGTFHSEGHDGVREEHPDLGHALMHVAHQHAPEGKHMHIHHDGMMMHSHGVNEASEHEGTHDHENIEELKESMGKFLDEEGQENSENGAEHDEQENGGQLGGFNG
jgi:hypothetical protein